MTRIQILNDEVIGDLTLFESSSDQQKSIMSLQMKKKVQKAKGIVKVVNTVLDFFGIGAIGIGSEVIDGSDDSATSTALIGTGSMDAQSFSTLSMIEKMQKELTNIENEFHSFDTNKNNKLSKTEIASAA
jgi:hypothetical protein